jgi:hypothetical protein
MLLPGVQKRLLRIDDIEVTWTFLFNGALKRCVELLGGSTLHYLRAVFS